jgi:FAD dependent oxidoreductase
MRFSTKTLLACLLIAMVGCTAQKPSSTPDQPKTEVVADKKIAASATSPNKNEESVYDIVIYGDTCAAVIAAAQAKQMGKSVIIVAPQKHLGGLSSSGLGWTDSGNKKVIGGLARDFYHRIYKYYEKPESWRWQKHEDYGNAHISKDGKTPPTRWVFEPHIAEAVFEDLIREYEIPVVRDAWLDRNNGVQKSDGKIESITTTDGKTYRGRMFIDTTYEGDLLAAAGVSYTVGRESNDKYGETMNGVQTQRAISHQFNYPVSAYKVPGDPKSGLLPRIDTSGPGEEGSGDHRVQAYCYRLCLTQKPENRVPFTKPEGYDPAQYELLARYLAGGWRDIFNKFDPIPNLKTDTNNRGAFSTDNIGMNYEYPEASYEKRQEILKEHETYQKGWLYFLANDPNVPEDVLKKMSSWGLSGDEFEENGHWPYQIYVREARRMVSDFVMTEPHLRRTKPTPDVIGMGAYNMDSHNVQRYVDEKGNVHNEGDIQINPGGPYPISYRAIVPKQDECENLLVPVCLSSSHISYGSIRMEPVFMILGQSAATAAAMAIEAKVPVQKVDYTKLQKRLLDDGQVLKYDGPRPKPTRIGINAKTLPGILVDDLQATLIGEWTNSKTVWPWVGQSYRTDGNENKGARSASFEAQLPKPGKYEVRVSSSPYTNRASNAQIVVHHAGGTTTKTIDQRKTPPIDKLFFSLGTFDFKEIGVVEFSNKDTKGHLIVDAVQWLPVEDKKSSDDKK